MNAVFTIIKNIFLFLASPFIALAYIIALPMVGFYMVLNSTIEIISNKLSESKRPSDTTTYVRL